VYATNLLPIDISNLLKRNEREELLSLPTPFRKSLVGHRPNERKLAHRGLVASPVAIVVSMGTRNLLVRDCLGLFMNLE